MISNSNDTSSDITSALLHNLDEHGNESNLADHSTSILIIVTIHLIWGYQWFSKQTRNDIVTSYRQVVIQKRFHRALYGVLSHPSLDNISRQSQSSVVIDVGTSDDRETTSSDHETFSPYQGGPLRIARSIATRIKSFATSFVTNSPLMCLPLIAYISHILWQVRSLEEIYDFEYDRQHHHNVSSYETTLNITSVLEAEKILKYAFIHQETHVSRSQTVGPFRYYRVCVTLILTSFMLEMLMTHLCLTYIRHLRIPALRSSSAFDKLMDRGICTMIPLCTSLVGIYESFFPHTSISVVPFFNTSYIGITSSAFGFVMVCVILCSLSYKVYPLLGVFYGSISGILWVKGMSCFLATKYWGGWNIMTLILMCILGYKSEYLQLKKSGQISSQIDWFPWIDVSWDGISEVDEEHDRYRNENDEEWNNE